MSKDKLIQDSFHESRYFSGLKATGVPAAQNIIFQFDALKSHTLDQVKELARLHQSIEDLKKNMLKQREPIPATYSTVPAAYSTVPAATSAIEQVQIYTQIVFRIYDTFFIFSCFY